MKKQELARYLKRYLFRGKSENGQINLISWYF